MSAPISILEARQDANDKPVCILVCYECEKVGRERQRVRTYVQRLGCKPSQVITRTLCGNHYQQRLASMKLD